MEKKVLLIECPDSKGLIAQITNICYKHQLNIIRNTEYVDPDSGQFFMRTQLEGIFNDKTLMLDLDRALPQGSSRQLVAARRKKVVILVTKEAHCLGDILMKVYDGSLKLDIAAVVGNHPDLQSLAEKFDIPYHFVSHIDRSREQHEAALQQVIDPYQADYLVLAKFMRVLSPAFVAHYKERIINIHHSFLPAFIGANPYHQAHKRGVKIIGATAHFVTDDLDEGPIIKQLVTPVDHTYSAMDMVKAGRDVEKNVLSKALQLVLEDRVFVHGNKTVIL
ncbi:MAG: formyltetrahydrofolate deformylase [Gammaproteobacteria bacterium]|nr:formyltetrahydrofolate deformylase [Gammaproteobacteria bacterium]MBU2058533.1 formyltetrahydrofolate deformylase [Gammaproteobacteria bacterium]MBU2175558.1 formyltetrahydrofolate deformylase [Gammaproteobacteria bacterium]MBU2248644.1 formyltetrahydrofolate deformylase [Gammaproteobacteria bacterium]MBU2344817.1 formyltetrahydrofolate deformylase [Gammaproteobacteria bacterium]